MVNVLRDLLGKKKVTEQTKCDSTITIRRFVVTPSDLGDTGPSVPLQSRPSGRTWNSHGEKFVTI